MACEQCRLNHRMLAIRGCSCDNTAPVQMGRLLLKRILLSNTSHVQQRQRQQKQEQNGNSTSTIEYSCLFFESPHKLKTQSIKPNHRKSIPFSMFSRPCPSVDVSSRIYRVRDRSVPIKSC